MKVLFVETEETFYMPVNTKIPKRWTYLAEIATYVAENNEVRVMDCLSPQISHSEILTEISTNKYDLVCFLVRIETVNSLLKLIPLIKKISPESKLLAYGDAVCMFPNYIKNNMTDLDAIVEKGDWEVAITNYIKFISGDKDANISGITIKDNDIWKRKIGKIDNTFRNWKFTNLKENSTGIDTELYKLLRNNEVTITASRGCPYNCKFCLAVKTFDRDDRRKEIDELIMYMIENKKEVGNYKLFSPTFTYDEIWTKKFSKALIEQNENISWVTTSRTDKLQDEEMIELMAKAGCNKIAVGVETLDINANRELNKFSNLDNYKNKVKNMFEICKKYKIEIKPLLMMGIKGQTKNNILESLNFLTDCGAKTIRVSAYSPRQILSEKDEKGILTLKEINEMDKMTFIDYMPANMNEKEFLNLIYNTENYKSILKPLKEERYNG